jgi:ABC-type transport system involved in cytochrome c biogenesis permease subunit
VYRSGFLPRFLGVWLFINGIAYIATTFTGILLPEQMGIVRTITFPILFGELAFVLWLLIIGARQGQLKTVN